MKKLFFSLLFIVFAVNNCFSMSKDELEDAGNKIEKMILVVYGLRSKYPERVLDLGELEKEFIKLSTKVENYTRVNFIQEISQILKSWKKDKIEKGLSDFHEDKVSLNNEIIRLNKELTSKEDELKKLEASLNTKRFMAEAIKNMKLTKIETLTIEIQNIKIELELLIENKQKFDQFDEDRYKKQINDIRDILNAIIEPA